MADKLDYFSDLAVKALLYEVALTPKPGLVDRQDNGAHRDMTFQTFLDSSLALAPFFRAYARAGFEHGCAPLPQLFDRLRQIGLEAERAMFTATGGVNTHKGINFSLALLLGAAGHYLADKPDLLARKKVFSPADSLAVCQLAIPMTEGLLAADLGQLRAKKELTHGERLYLEHGIKGPRGEASAGFPTLTDQALPFFRDRLREGDQELAQLQLLLFLMTIVEDGNLIHRGGLEAWQTIRQEAQALLTQKLPKAAFQEALSRYNQVLITRNLSPGGTADLLTLTLYLAFLEGLLPG